MPLVNKDGSEFDSRNVERKSIGELRKEAILPDIDGFYNIDTVKVDAVLISHPHLDHYGLGHFVNTKIPFYLGEATHKLIDITRLFIGRGLEISKAHYFDHRETLSIGDLTITPYLNDHSGFNAYGFLIEGDGKRIYYTGDFRAHGRKEGIFHQFVNDPPANIDCLLMEGTNIGNVEKTCQKEEKLEDELITIINESSKLTLFQTSGQNIDRLVTFFRACRRSNKILVLDIYTSTVLFNLFKFRNTLPYPSKSFPEIKVFFTKFHADILGKNDHDKLLYYFNNFRVRKEDIEANPEKYVMITRPSMKYILDKLNNIDGGDYIYSLWGGYLEKEWERQFKDYLINRGFEFHHIHTSGHADLKTLKKMVNAVNPKWIIPIHTFNSRDYEEHFSHPVKVMQDGETLNV
ncbi:MAG: beta-lactamase domain protein [Candidatus Scalindua rubra]|uniref:Beta-lactamase domain protein n=1 Tax=Candidatus Scalindua rubra TaxID=1872076 RepID=A0A1E3X2R5_9BACT|nr:MAG: beta-lactamase domain protein [Candidatus Scalindua rubra]